MRWSFLALKGKIAVRMEKDLQMLTNYYLNSNMTMALTGNMCIGSAMHKNNIVNHECYLCGRQTSKNIIELSHAWSNYAEFADMKFYNIQIYLQIKYTYKYWKPQKIGKIKIMIKFLKLRKPSRFCL